VGQSASNNKRGFTLIELMIAMLIIMISMLALLTSIVTSMAANTSNEIRNTAIKVTNETAEALLALPIDDAELSTGTLHTNTPSTWPAGQQVKGFPNPTQRIRAFDITYVITWSVTAPSSNLKQISISVAYSQKNQNYTNSSLVYKHRAI
jgi:prepilin-type N-terminal cleavage/methylation domain-containing protein